MVLVVLEGVWGHHLFVRLLFGQFCPRVLMAAEVLSVVVVSTKPSTVALAVLCVKPWLLSEIETSGLLHGIRSRATSHGLMGPFQAYSFLFLGEG